MLFKVASQNWEERSLKWAPNIRLSHVCLGGKKNVCLCFSVVDFSCLYTVTASRFSAVTLLKFSEGAGGWLTWF